MTLKPADEFGPVLAGRGLASALREEIERALVAGHEVVVDLADVDTVSPSFADELFGKLAGAGAGLSFVNVPPEIEPLVRFVVSGRQPA